VRPPHGESRGQGRRRGRGGRPRQPGRGCGPERGGASGSRGKARALPDETPLRAPRAARRACVGPGGPATLPGGPGQARGLGRSGCRLPLRGDQGEAEMPTDFRARMLGRVDGGKYRGALNDWGFILFFNTTTRPKTHPEMKL
jgi:hypothetical protein